MTLPNDPGAIDLIEIMITRSSNPATDALLAAVGGPGPVNAWMQRQGLGQRGFRQQAAPQQGAAAPVHQHHRRRTGGEQHLAAPAQLLAQRLW